jgi:plasmid stability protein
MREIVIKNLDDAAIERLERRAAANGWSLEEEVWFLLTEGIKHMEELMSGLDLLAKNIKERRSYMERRNKALFEETDKLLREHSLPARESTEG